jgi:two-component system chemotaxis response regulator CheY
MINVLIVDDSRTSRKILRGTLEAEGFNIIGEAGDGVEGVAQFTELKPDVVTMDITMPNKDGIEALKDIIALDSSAKVVMVTAAGQKNKMIEALKAGACDFISKPFDAEVVVNTLKKVVNKVG